jgi:hypothetical protein
MMTRSQGELVAVYGEYAGPSPYAIAGVESIPMLTECEGMPVEEHAVTPASRPARAHSEP